MSESEKLSQKSTESEQLYPQNCPICGISTNYVYNVKNKEEDESGIYYKCSCGVIFQKDLPNGEYGKDYYDGTDTEFAKKGIQYAPKLYLPLIEELTYGRKMLDVGFGVKHVMDLARERGWLTWGIDKNYHGETDGRVCQGDFLNYDFNIYLEEKDAAELDKAYIERKFDLIWMGHSLEYMIDPVAAINKAKNLLSETGVLYISTPDIEFLHKTGIPSWGHWKKNEHYIMWSEQALIRELQRAGFKVVMSRRNYSARFFCWYDLHIICQKNYF